MQRLLLLRLDFTYESNGEGYPSRNMPLNKPTEEPGPDDSVHEPLEGLGTRITMRFAGVGLIAPLLEMHSPILCTQSCMAPERLTSRHNLTRPDTFN